MRALLIAVVLTATLLPAAPARADMHQDLRWAAAKGDREEAARLLLIGANIASQDEYGYTPLHWAAYQGSLLMTEFLLERGAPLNALSKDGYTPLMVAISRYKGPIAKVLLDRGADPAVKTPKGSRAVDFARRNGLWDLVDRLDPPRMTPPQVEEPSPSPAPKK